MKICINQNKSQISNSFTYDPAITPNIYINKMYNIPNQGLCIGSGRFPLIRVKRRMIVMVTPKEIGNKNNHIKMS